MRTDVRVTGDRAISADRIGNVQGRASIARLQKRKWGGHRGDMTGALRVRRIDGLSARKIDIVQLLSGRCRQSRSSFCRAFLLSRTSSRKLNPDRLRIRYLRLRGSFWKRQRVTMYN